jgi:hypothetical protein
MGVLALGMLGLAGAGAATQIAAVQSLLVPAVTAVPTDAASGELPARPQLASQLTVPPDPAAPGLMWFAPSGGSAADGHDSGPGLWRRLAPGDAWEWEALPPEAVAVRVFAGAGVPSLPAWPDDSTRLRAERVVDPAGPVLGHWVWNAAYFAQQASGSHRWEPHWAWAPAGEPVLLIPEVWPLEPDGPAYRISTSPQQGLG